MNDEIISETGDPVLTAEEANWALVRSSLAAMSQQQSELIAEMRETRRIDGLLLVDRFDGFDARLDRMTRAIALQTDLMEAMNSIVSGVRSASNSTYNMATSAARKIERVRQFLKVPDEVVYEAPAAGEGVAGASDRPPRPIRG